MRIQVLIVTLLLFWNCSKNKQTSEVVSISGRSEEVKEKLRKLVFIDGDIKAYEELDIAYVDHPSGEFLPYAFLMAHKYNYPKAYYDVFENLLKLDGCSIDYDLTCLDKETKSLALKYFKTAINTGDPSASYVLVHFFLEGSDSYIKGNFKVEDKELIKKARMNLSKK